MANIVPVPLTEPAAHRLADMRGVLFDLRWVSGLCRKLKEFEAAGNADVMLCEALQSAAIVRYGRCYSGGSRTAFVLDEQWIQKLPAALRAAHREFYLLRDKHIAHSINDWEINEPVALVRVVEGEAPLVVAVDVHHRHAIAISSAAVESLEKLASTLGDKVEIEVNAERARMLELAQTLPPDELLRRARLPVRFPGKRHLGTARGRMKHRE